jgi:hypothetical protein
MHLHAYTLQHVCHWRHCVGYRRIPLQSVDLARNDADEGVWNYSSCGIKSRGLRKYCNGE